MPMRKCRVIDENRGETMVRKAWTCVGLGLVVAASVLSAQNNAPAKSAAASKPVKAESVTINMPEGMTRDQADAILSELKEIHQLLLNPPAARAAAAAPASVAPNERVSNEKVKMSVG